MSAFRIAGPLVGVPLIFRDEVVGVLVTWSRKNPPPTEEHEARLETFARLAAMSIATVESDRQRESTLRIVREICKLTPVDFSGEEKLKLVMEGLREIGFDRVGLFEYRHVTDEFHPVQALGMDERAFMTCVIDVRSNPYARHTVQTFRDGPVVACKYDPGRIEWFGDDPDGQRLGKPPDFPWAIVPLVVAGTLYGEMYTDNATTRREITPDHIEGLSLLAHLRDRRWLTARPVKLSWRQGSSHVVQAYRCRGGETSGDPAAPKLHDVWRRPWVLPGDLLGARGPSRQVRYSAGIGSVRREEALGIWEVIRHKTLTLDDILKRASESWIQSWATA